MAIPMNLKNVPISVASGDPLERSWSGQIEDLFGAPANKVTRAQIDQLMTGVEVKVPRNRYGAGTVELSYIPHNPLDDPYPLNNQPMAVPVHRVQIEVPPPATLKIEKEISKHLVGQHGLKGTPVEMAAGTSFAITDTGYGSFVITQTSTSTPTAAWINTASTATTVATNPGQVVFYSSPVPDSDYYGDKKLPRGKALKVELPDGSIFDVKADGSYTVLDKDAKIHYKANRVKEFNKYINASDLLVEFVEYLAAKGLKKKEAMEIPIDLFIAFLIIRAAENDGDAAPATEQLVLEQAVAQKTVLALPPPAVVIPIHKYHCRCCGKFIPKNLATSGYLFCSPEHANKKFEALQERKYG